MDNGSQDSLMIERLPQGGYIVRDGIVSGGMYRCEHYASTTIDEALKFIRDKIAPVQPMTFSATSEVLKDAWK